MRIIFFGSSKENISAVCLQHLIEKGCNIVAIVTNKDKSYKGYINAFTLYKNIPIIQVDDLNSIAFANKIKEFKPDLQIVVAFRILPKEIFTIPKLGTINLHPSLLPEYRGPAPIQWAIINGEKKTGVTTFYIDEKIDEGNIIYQKGIQIKKTDTYTTLENKLSEAGAKLLYKTIKGIKSTKVRRNKQVSYFFDMQHPITKKNISLHKAPKIFSKDCKIDWTKNTIDIYNLIRGVDAWTEINTKNGIKILKIIEAHMHLYNMIYYSKYKFKPGIIFFTDNYKHMFISTKDGYIELFRVQLEGKKQMNILDFINGIKNILC